MTTLIIIPCLNEEQNIERLVNYVLKENLASALIIIADGGSSDQTPQIAQKLAAQYLNVYYLYNIKRIQSAAVNLAVKTYAKDAEFFIRLDAHADYPENYCRTLIEEARATQAASVVVSMKTQGKGGFQDAVAEAQNSKLGNGGSSHRNDAAEGSWVDHGHHALMRVDAFQTVGGYDEHFSHNEDAELDVRLRKADFTLWLTAKTYLIYYPRSTVLSLFRQYYNYGRGRFRTIAKHRTSLKVRQMLPVAIAPVVLFGLLGSTLSWIFALPLMIWILAVLTCGVQSAISKSNPILAFAGIAILIMHFAWSLGFWKGALDASKAGYRE